jgi:uncharacterized membrane protein
VKRNSINQEPFIAARQAISPTKGEILFGEMDIRSKDEKMRRKINFREALFRSS